ncbi:MAG: translation initiation factor IF-2 [Bacteroidales bacterium]|nr:translation initiation factor IF-2 [Bacteroidales bacterium]
MAESIKPIRLSKAAKEFNVGISTIVEFLSKKGTEISASPNTKLSPEMYKLLEQEFQSQKSVKEEAKKIGLDYSDHQTISIEDKIALETDEEQEDEFEEVFIKDISLKKTEKEKEAKPEITEEKPVAKEKEPAPEKEEKEVKKEEPVAEKQEKEEEPVEEAKEEKPVEEPVPEEVHVEEVEAKEETEEESKAPVEEKAAEQPEEDPQVDEEGKLKVLGKIDLSTLNDKTRPPRKSAAEKKKERELKKKQREEAKQRKDKPVEKEPVKKEEKPVEAKKPEPKVEEKPVEEPRKKEEKPVESVYKTEVQRLTGPKILDKIELPQEKKKQEKKPVASSKDQDLTNRKKKKRKRIQKGPNKQDDQGGKFDGQKDRKGGGGSRDKRGRRDRERPEISEEDVQQQIKETLAKLTGGGKSKAVKHRREKRQTMSQQRQKELEKQAEEKNVIKVTEFVTANELANMMSVPVNQIIATCMSLGLFVSINQRLDAETLSLVAEEFGYEVEFVSVEVAEAIHETEQEDDDPESVLPRSPIVTVMGHVDHGKTKLLDYIRKSNVVAGEAGGITQHIGAYEVELDGGKKITFLDTPGHEAFTAMRARGAKITDVAIIVVAADDNVMPQTKEAINHAQAAGVPIVFAINKIDKPQANPEKIKEELSKMNILVEDWGGKFQSQEISAKQGINVDELLDKVLLEAELLDLKANPNKPAHGTIIESSLDKGRGYVAKMLVQDGSLKTGDMVIAGSTFGKVKAMYNERNLRINDAGPSTPVLLLGLNGAPQAGDSFNVMRDEREAKAIATKRLQLQREQGIRTQKHITLDEIGRRIAIGDFKELNIIVKGDVDGSVEALSDSLLKLSNEQIQVNIIHKSVGQVTETDVMLASASDAVIVAFQVRPSLSARKLAEQEQIDIRLYSIIYQAIEEIKAAMEGMLSPDIEEKIVCNVEVRHVFKISKVGTVAGCYVLDGTITRKTRVRVIRDGIVIYTGLLGSLKRFKDDAKEVKSGYECGLNIENFNDIKVGDIIEGYEEVEVKRTLS